jgi:Sec-independent protein translocase protein TatA
MAKADEEKELTWEDHLAAAIKAFRKEAKEWRGELLPEEFKTHRRAAQREMLLAMRSLIDAKIEKLEKAEKDKAASKATRIKVE